MIGSYVLERSLASLVPLVTTGLAAVIDLLPFASLGPGSVAPWFTLLLAYHWTLARPDLLSALDLFVIGLAADLVGGTPPGMTSFILLGVRRFVLAPQRPALGASYAAAWGGFALTSLLAGLLAWFAVSLLEMAIVPLGAVLVRSAVTVALYPPVALVLAQLERHLPGAVDAADR
jgi:rod shape-determining protein MreD